MPTSLGDADVLAALSGATPGYPSPADWRDISIYFLLVDRFNNPTAPPRFLPFDAPQDAMQGGTLNGITAKMAYLKSLGVGAIWISPILKNSPQLDKFYGGYMIQDFLTVEPRFTSNPAKAQQDSTLGDKELRALVDAAHANGLYVIFDIVLNHAGDIFNYEGAQESAPWRGPPAPEYTIFWRDDTGNFNGGWMDIGAIAAQQPIGANAAIWPKELQRNDFFRRRGSDGPDDQGDFWIFKELVTEYLAAGNRYPVRDILIKAYQYLIAKFDIDGFRIDTLMYVEREFARVFGNSMREFALSIGKKNFFTFGEVWEDGDDADWKIGSFVGRNTKDGDDMVGVDAALDFPIYKRLRDVVRGFQAPQALAGYYQFRKDALAEVSSSHGDAGRYFVTFLDNHDLNDRLYFQDPQNSHKYDMQFTQALACLLCLQGVPCIYYGNEQGLHGSGDRREYVREALWGMPGGFDSGHPFYKMIQSLLAVRKKLPALRYGRQYFREVSGDGQAFGISPFPGGILAFSRVLNDKEVVVIANTSTTTEWSGYVVVDDDLQEDGDVLGIQFSNHPTPRNPGVAGTSGVYRAVKVTLYPMEVQVLAMG